LEPVLKVNEGLHLDSFIIVLGKTNEIKNKHIPQLYAERKMAVKRYPAGL